MLSPTRAFSVSAGPAVEFRAGGVRERSHGGGWPPVRRGTAELAPLARYYRATAVVLSIAVSILIRPFDRMLLLPPRLRPELFVSILIRPFDRMLLL